MNASAQMWDISRAENGRTYVANENGLLEYNGLNWDAYPLPNHTVLRAVCAVEDSVYTGSYQEFGYWKKNVFGQLEYFSMTRNLPDDYFKNEEFWQILPFGENIYFRSFYAVYKTENNDILRIECPSTVMNISLVNGEVLVSTLEDGIFLIEGRKLIPYISKTLLKGMKIIGIQIISKGEILIGTERNGCFIYDGKLLSPFEISVNEKLKKFQLNKMKVLENGNFLFGTIQNGLYYINGEGKEIFHFTKNNGLSNNTVLSMYVDENQQLWVGLDNGFSQIDFLSKNLFYTDNSGVLGTVFDIERFENTTYIGSNTGLYYLNTEGQLEFVEGTQGQVWELKKWKDDLFCGHNSGTFLIHNKKASLVSSQAGGWELRPTPALSNVLLQGTYSGIVRYELIDGNWNSEYIENTNFPIRHLEFLNDNTVLAVHANQGLYKITFRNGYHSIQSIKRINAQNGSDYNLRIYKWKNQIYLKNNTDWLKYLENDSLVIDRQLNKNFGRQSYVISENIPHVLALKNESNIEFRSWEQPDSIVSIIDEYYADRIINNNTKINDYNADYWSLNENYGFMLIGKQRNSTSQLPIYAPSIERIGYNQQWLTIENEDKYKIPYKHQEFIINVSSPRSLHYFIEYKIENNSDDYWHKLKGSELKINHLESGENVIIFRAVNNLNQYSEPVEISVEVAPIWYNSIPMWMVYILFLFAIIYFYTRYHSRKIEKKKAWELTNIVKEQEDIRKKEALVKEREIVRLKNEALRKEVKHKSKELANNALSIIRKNESLSKIKNQLEQIRKKNPDSKELDKVLNSVNLTLKQKNKDWDLFEINFDKVHEEFFEVVIHKHPDLSKRDLQLCAYVKMNLTAKEIAPILGISIRGVETQKYRLKKKLDIDKKQNLSEYLNQIY